MCYCLWQCTQTCVSTCVLVKTHFLSDNIEEMESSRMSTIDVNMLRDEIFEREH